MKNVCGVPEHAVRADGVPDLVEADRVGRAVASPRTRAPAPRLSIDVDADDDDRLRPTSAATACSSRGISCLHGMQSDAQKLRTTALPR